MAKTFLQPRIAGFAARIKQQPEDFRVTELPLATSVHSVPAGIPDSPGHQDFKASSCSAERPPKRAKLGTDKKTVEETACHSSGLAAAASVPTVSAPSGELRSSVDLATLPLPDETSLLTSSPISLPACCAMPALRKHGANLLNVLAPDRAEALFAFAELASAQLQEVAPATQEQDRAEAVTLGTIAKAALRDLHHGVKMMFPWLDTHTTARADGDVSREINARPDDKFKQLVSVMHFQEACNCVRFARFGAGEPHAELGLALGADKERRTQVHRAVGSVYRMLESKTKSSPVGDLIAVRYRSTGGGRGKSKGRGRGHGHANQRQLSSNSSISCCLSFTLEKRGVETLDALQQIATILEVPVASFGYAGTKDAYAVTRQSVTVNIEGQDEEVCLQRLKALVSNDALVSRGLRVEDPALRRTGGMLQLGQHAGNHFKIVLRGALEAQPQSPAAVEDAAIRQSKWTTVEAAARSLKRHGFINYFGEQRFQGGMEAENTTDVIGLLLLKHDWVGAVTRFLGPDPAESNERTRQARALVTVGVPLEMAAVVKMLELFPAHKIREKLMLKAMRRHGTDSTGCLKAIWAVPYRMRMLWLHAYQSKLWNILATERVRIGRSNRDPFAALPGDLVRVRTQTAGQSSSGSVMVEEKDSVMRLGANNSCASATADDKYTLQDVLLPVLGRGSELPATEFGDACRKSLTADGLTLPQMDAKEIGIKLQGSLRPLVVRAEDLSWARCNDCTDPSAAKVQTPKEEADKPVSMEDGEHDDIGRDDVVMSFQLRPGSYALEAMRELMK